MKAGSSHSIEALIELAEEASVRSVATDARSLLARLREGRFYVACLGQFKRGKSTLINALLGDEVLPSGAAPVTSAITVVRHGDPGARVRLGDGAWSRVALDELGSYVSEAGNPENHKGVTGVEVFCHSRFLERGLCLVDTPGIGSVFEGNTEETRSFVPHIDAAIVVLGGDPPISGEELDLVKNVASRIEHILFAFNKSDRLSDLERSESLAFTRTILRERAGLEQPPLFEVSALERLGRAGPERDWGAFLDWLEALAAGEGGELLAEAAARGLDLLARRLAKHLHEEKTALLRPVQESERRLELLRRCAEDAGRAARELRYQFEIEQERLAARFDEERRRFLAESIPEVEKNLRARLETSSFHRGFRRHTIDESHEVVQTAVSAWMEKQSPLAEREFAALTERFVTTANQFLDRLHADGHLPPDALPAHLVAERGFRTRSRYYFASFTSLRPPLLRPWLADWFRSQSSARRSAEADAVAYARRLLTINAGRVIEDFDGRITESRRRVEAALRRTLEEVVSSAAEAARNAREIQQRGEEAVRDRLALVDDLSDRLARLSLNPPQRLDRPAAPDLYRNRA